jgi:hypothetical protein
VFDALVDSAARDLMSIQFGTVYMTSYGDFDNPVIGVVIRRMWWKPWRYSVKPVYWDDNDDDPHVWGYRGLGEGSVIYNLTKAGAIGMAKLYGVKHQDFEGELK